MGIERDYLMRQLQMLFDAIQKIIRLRRKGDTGQALDEIKDFYSCLRIEDNIDNLSIEELIEYLAGKKNLANEQLELIALVLKEQGELAETEDRQLDFFRKAYFLMDKVERESTTFSFGRQMQLAELRALANGNVPNPMPE